MLSSDKPVYQPGQVIRLRSLALAQPELRPVAGHAVAYAIRDPKGNVIFRKQDVTSRFGIASADCPLADEIAEGSYQIQCQVGDTASTATVEVKKYVLPKFRVDVSLDQPYYQPGQKAHGTVDARYFFGKPVENAAVEIVVEARDVAAETVCRLERRTNAAGAAEFEFSLPDELVGREQLSGSAEIAVHATAVDSAGQKASKSVSRVVTAQPIRIEVMPESASLVRGVANFVYLYTSYPDGRPAETRIAVSGIHDELASDRLGIARVELTPDSDQVDWTVRATDANGKTASREVILTCGRSADDFLVRTDAAVYDGGATLRVVVLGGGDEPVFLDLIKDGQTMLTDMVPMAGGRGQYAFDFPSEVFGTIELSAYRYGAAGLPVRKTQVIYVRQAGAVKIETALDRREYRPGKSAKLHFALTDGQHRPVPGALSLAAVDEAVFSVLERRPGMENAFFTLEQELLKPVYAVYPWSPGGVPDVPLKDRSRFEKCLFSRAARTPADRSGRVADFLGPQATGNVSWPVRADEPGREEPIDEAAAEPAAHEADASEAYTLEGASYPAMVREFEQQHARMQEIISKSWFGLAIAVILVCLGVLLRPLGRAVALEFAWNPEARGGGHSRGHDRGYCSRTGHRRRHLCHARENLRPSTAAAPGGGSRSPKGVGTGGAATQRGGAGTAGGAARSGRALFIGVIRIRGAEEAADRPKAVFAGCRTGPRPRLVPGNAALAAGADYRRPGPGDAGGRPGRLDHHLAALGQCRDGRRRAGRGAAADPRLPAVLRRPRSAGRAGPG